MGEVTYTERDFETVQQSFLSLIRAKFGRNWREIVNTSVGMAIVNIIGWSHEQLNFYLDLQAINTYLTLATLPDAMENITKGQGYKIRRKTSASVPVVFIPNPTQPVPITIPKGEKVTVDDMVFESDKDYVIPANVSKWPANNSETEAIFIQGESFSESFLSNGEELQEFLLKKKDIVIASIRVFVDGLEWVREENIYSKNFGFGHDTFIGDGISLQKFKLTQTDVNEESIVVIIENTKWKKVDVFTGAINEYQISYDNDDYYIIFNDISAPESNIDCFYLTGGKTRHYAIKKDNDNISVQFGDDSVGKIPAYNAEISVEYYANAYGVKGNIVKGRIDDNVHGYLTSGALVNVRVINHVAGSGGNEQETIEEIRFNAPNAIKTNSRAITKSDFIALAMNYESQYGSVAYASAYLKRKVPEENIIMVDLWARDSLGRISAPSIVILEEIKAFLKSRTEICTDVETDAGTVTYFDVFASVLLDSGYSPSHVLADVNADLLEYFNASYTKIDQSISLSRILAIIQNHNNILRSQIELVRGTRLLKHEYIGNGTKINFSGFFDIPQGQSIIDNTFKVYSIYPSLNIYDSDGNIIGDIDNSYTQIFDKETGFYSVYFSEPPDDESIITAECRYQNVISVKEEITIEGNKLDGIINNPKLVPREYVGIGSGANVVGTLPEIFLPYGEHKIVFVGGFDNYNQNLGGQLVAYDNGEGILLGDGYGEIDYSTGEFELTWNTLPPPITGQTLYGYLIETPDGSITDFTFEIRDQAGGLGNLVDISSFGIGRVEIELDGFSLFDNGQGKIVDYFWLSKEGFSLINYSVGTGNIRLNSPLPASFGQNFTVKITSTTLFLYSPFVAYQKNGDLYNLYVYTDNSERCFGNVLTAYPYTKVDFLSGRYLIDLNKNISGNVILDYDSFQESKCGNLPASDNSLSAISTVSLTPLQG